MEQITSLFWFFFYNRGCGAQPPCLWGEREKAAAMFGFNTGIYRVVFAWLALSRPTVLAFGAGQDIDALLTFANEEYFRT